MYLYSSMLTFCFDKSLVVSFRGGVTAKWNLCTPQVAKPGNSVTHLQKAAISQATASSQMFEWYLPHMEDLHLEGSVPC